MLKISWQTVLLVLILLLATFLYTYRLSHLMAFTGDVAWFYLDARDLLLGKSFPLVGITSSHTWIHHGAYWTYLLAIALWIGKFNPLSGGYLSAGIGVLTVLSMYVIGKKYFGVWVGILAALFYTLSPFAIMNTRIPLNTTPLVFLSLWFLYFLIAWVRGRAYSLVILCGILALLYNFELGSIMLFVPFTLVGLYGWWYQTSFFRQTVNRRSIASSLLLSGMIMLPMIIYDVSHGYPQTVRFIVWIVYRLFVTIGIFPLGHTTQTETWGNFFTFLLPTLSHIFYLLPSFLAILLGGRILWGLISITRKKRTNEYIILLVSILSTTSIFMVYKTTSETYIPLFFAYLFLSLAVIVMYIPQTVYRVVIVVLLVCAGISGIRTFVSKDYEYASQHPYVFSYDDRQHVVKTIIQKTGKSTYTIEGKNMFIVTPSFTMNYEYLLWYLGHPVVEEFPEKMITIEETPDRIQIGEK